MFYFRFDYFKFLYIHNIYYSKIIYNIEFKIFNWIFIKKLSIDIISCLNIY